MSISTSGQSHLKGQARAFSSTSHQIGDHFKLLSTSTCRSLKISFSGRNFTHPNAGLTRPLRSFLPIQLGLALCLHWAATTSSTTTVSSQSTKNNDLEIKPISMSRDTVITCLVNTATCLLAGTVTFSILGHMAHNQGVDVASVNMSCLWPHFAQI